MQNKNIFYAILHGVVSAIVINIRILGVLVPLFTLCTIFFDAVSPKNSVSVKFKKYLSLILSYICSNGICTILFWPWLWEAPLTRFIQAFTNMSKFRWDGLVLYLGQFIASTNLPWHYIPVWIMITTPLAYTLLFTIGLFCLWKRFFVKPVKQNWSVGYIYLIIISAWLFIPISTIIYIEICSL